ncbi:MAG: dihydropteroate synthase [Pseudomonadota bacterium]
MRDYYRPLLSTDPVRPPDALTLAGGWAWFNSVHVMSRTSTPRVMPATDLCDQIRCALTSERAPVGGTTLDQPRVLGILNVTPDSFSDGGDHVVASGALRRSGQMWDDGVNWIDIGAESTRPGAQTVPVNEELARLAPYFDSGESLGAFSIDTRKAVVAQSALGAGAVMVNDVSAMAFDPDMTGVMANSEAAVCLVHAQGDPETMQQNPTYEDVLFDVYDSLAVRVAYAEAAGITRDRIVLDPGIGFGKTLEHNLTLLQDIALFHSLGCALMVGASRKGFVGKLSGVDNPKDRVAGSLAVALAMAAQGVQIHRVHDVAETVQGFRMLTAIWGHATDDSEDT